MIKNNKSNIIREIPGGRQIKIDYNHQTEYNSWKSVVSYCNTTYGTDDGKRYSIKKDAANKKITISAKWMDVEKTTITWQ